MGMAEVVMGMVLMRLRSLPQSPHDTLALQYTPDCLLKALFRGPRERIVLRDQYYFIILTKRATQKTCI